MRLRPVVALAVVPVLSVALAGCGQSAIQKYSKTAPATIDQDMRTALTGMKSVYVTTSYTDSGTTFTMDAKVDSAGHCLATLTEGAQSLTLIATSPTAVYAKGSATFWGTSVGLSAATAEALSGKWVTGIPTSMFSGICSLKEVISPFTTATVSADKPKVLGTAKVAGNDVVRLQITSSGTTAVLAVTASSPHYPLTVVSSDGKRTETLADFNATVKATAPTGAVDLSSLTGKK